MNISRTIASLINNSPLYFYGVKTNGLTIGEIMSELDLTAHKVDQAQLNVPLPKGAMVLIDNRNSTVGLG